MPQPPLQRVPLRGTKGDDFFVPQLDDYSCGPACLATIARIYGCEGSYEDWRAEACPDPLIGTPEEVMQDLSELFLPCMETGEGIYVQGVAIACIMQGGEGHYVVMLAREDDKVVYYDPYEHELVLDRIGNIDWQTETRALHNWSINFAPIQDNSIQLWLDMAAPKEPVAIGEKRRPPRSKGPKL
jgi:hypothetical protein